MVRRQEIRIPAWKWEWIREVLREMRAFIAKAARSQRTVGCAGGVSGCKDSALAFAAAACEVSPAASYSCANADQTAELFGVNCEAFSNS
jgi:NH3-dependent NAD+ synthetase